MLVLQIVGWFLVGVVMLFLLLLLLNLRLCVYTPNSHGLCAELRLLCFRFSLYGGPKAQKKKAKKQKDEKAEKKNSFWQRFLTFLGLPEKEKVEKLQKEAKNSGIAERFFEVTELLKPALTALKETLRHVKLQQLEICYISGGEAAEAAIRYGGACATVYPLCALLQEWPGTKLHAVQPNLGCDYALKKSTFKLNLVLSVRMVDLFAAGMDFLKDYLKHKN